ncbi:hypothetical protein GCM10020256_08820 [Streptomyces thermocoprophilus]
MKYAAACSCTSRIRRAKTSIASPSSVSSTEWVSRSNSVRPVASSSLRTCWLTVDWRSPSRRAAWVKLNVCATARNVRSCEGSYIPPPYPRSSRTVMTVRAVYRMTDQSHGEQDGGTGPTGP